MIASPFFGSCETSLTAASSLPSGSVGIFICEKAARMPRREKIHHFPTPHLGGKIKPGGKQASRTVLTLLLLLREKWKKLVRGCSRAEKALFHSSSFSPFFPTLFSFRKLLFKGASFRENKMKRGKKKMNSYIRRGKLWRAAPAEKILQQYLKRAIKRPHFQASMPFVFPF